MEIIPFVIGFIAGMDSLVSWEGDSDWNAVLIFAVMLIFFSRKVLARLREMEEQELDATMEEAEVMEETLAIQLEESRSRSRSSSLSSNSPLGHPRSDQEELTEKDHSVTMDPILTPILHSKVSSETIESPIASSIPFKIEEDDDDLVDVELTSNNDFRIPLPVIGKSRKYKPFDVEGTEEQEIEFHDPSDAPDSVNPLTRTTSTSQETESQVTSPDAPVYYQAHQQQDSPTETEWSPSEFEEPANSPKIVSSEQDNDEASVRSDSDSEEVKSTDENQEQDSNMVEGSNDPLPEPPGIEEEVPHVEYEPNGLIEPEE